MSQTNLTLLIFLAAIAGCATQPAEVDIAPLDFTAELAADRAAAAAAPASPTPIQTPDLLTEDLLSLQPLTELEPRINISVQNRPAQLFFADLGASQGINMVVDPGVDELISLTMRDVTLTDVIAALEHLYGFELQATGYGYRVIPNQLATRVYRLNYLNLERSGSAQTTIGGDDTNMVTTSFAANGTDGSSFWVGISDSIKGFIAPQDEVAEPVVINTQTGLLVVHATTAEHMKIAQFLRDAELIMQKQVIIEAKIVEVVLDHQYRSGINWSIFNSSLADSDNSPILNLNANDLTGVDNLGGVFNLSVALDNFTTMLQLLDYQGDVKVLSSPRVATVNNQKAVIKVGTEEYFAIGASVTDSSDDSDSSNNVVELQQFFSGIALDVTPQIADDDSVTLHVRPTVTRVSETFKNIIIDGQTYSLPLAYSNIRESDSIIRAQSGQIIVIGGLLQQTQDADTSGLPMLNRLPFVRGLFSQDSEVQQKSELVILLKPSIYDENTTTENLDGVLGRLN